jgi:hypothetical protein
LVTDRLTGTPWGPGVLPSSRGEFRPRREGDVPSGLEIRAVWRSYLKRKKGGWVRVGG